MNRQNKLLTIGQFAAMHGINKKTLMWYDEIGLFRPASVNPENGYRYYDYHQSPVLETILLLRDLDVSIHEIQDFMKDRSAGNLKQLLEEKMADLDKQIAHLQAVRTTLSAHRQNMDTLLTMDLSEISVVEREERCLVTVGIDRGTSFEREVELITAETEKYQLGRLHKASYGSMISVSSLMSGRYDDYSRLFIEIPFLSYRAGLHMAPGGKYLRAFCKGEWDRLPKRYQEIFDYAREHGLTPYGYSYEMGINENVIERIEDYIVQIEIPITLHPAITQESSRRFG
ncbi:MerR family transcriptional regulator [uncultured Acetatifactor sp.]|jgi:DNA-binding transcriptional MerR regulator|uniref:MerR family transcriptional regulator n=1 Tax=uncultured Acetatifactor sp. TaxID=1671927 RepID=UPI002635A311|nr:MerR family transcriptional regulator [uncultured Acetatifactor sp.]